MTTKKITMIGGKKPFIRGNRLNVQQRVFVEHYVAGMSASAAAKAAGYKHDDSGSVLLKKPYVRSSIVQMQLAVERNSEMTKKKVMDGFLSAIEQAKTLGDPTAQIQGWNSVAKMCGYFEPQKHEVNISVQGKVVVERLQSMSDEELLKLATEQPNALEGEYTALDADDSDDVLPLLIERKLNEPSY